MLYYRLKILALRTLNAGAITCQQHAQHFHKHLHLHSAFASNSIHAAISASDAIAFKATTQAHAAALLI